MWCFLGLNWLVIFYFSGYANPPKLLVLKLKMTWPIKTGLSQMSQEITEHLDGTYELQIFWYQYQFHWFL